MKPTEEIRVGVYICHCGTNIAGVVDVKEVAEFAKDLDGVVVAKTMMYACSEPCQREIELDIKEQKLNRVVVAACSPKMHEPTFRAACERAGLNKYLFEMASIREQASWVHKNGHQATEKAKDLIKMAVARARLLQPLKDSEIAIGSHCLVIGGGIAGIQAALDLADSGYTVYLVEKDPFIGGRMAQLDKTFPTLDCSTCILAPKMSEVARHPNIQLLTNAEVKEVKGHVGNFSVTVRQKARFVSKACTSCNDCVAVCPITVPDEFNAGLSQRKAIYKTFPQAVPAEYAIDPAACLNKENFIACERCIEACKAKAISFDTPYEREFQIHADTVIVATGADAFDPSSIPEYGYGRFDDVISTLDFERIISPTGPTGGKLIRPSTRKPPERVAFIQCVGSRATNAAFGAHPYCSGICCMITIKQALLLKEKLPSAQITVYYIDIRAKGKGFEEMYWRARTEGIRFVKGIPSQITENPDKGLTLRGENILLSEVYEQTVDMVILSVGLEPGAGSKDLQKKFNLSSDATGFFLEKHPKLEPVDTAIAGVFLAGTAEGPKDIRESSIQAKAAASRASRLMKEGVIKIEALTAVVNEEQCTACKLCEKVCPFHAAQMDGKAKITEAACQGCGTCVAECPSNAIRQRHFTDEQILAQIDAALETDAKEKILVFACNWCSYAAADLAGISRMEYPASVRIIRTMCSGRIDEAFVLHAFKRGAGIVLMSGCHEGECHYIQGNLKAKERFTRWRKKLVAKGINPERLQLGWFSASEADKFVEKLKELEKLLATVTEEEIEKAVQVLV